MAWYSCLRPCSGTPAPAWALHPQAGTQQELNVQGPCPPQGDRCILGQQRSFRKRKSGAWCMQGQSYTSALTSRVCACRASDFLW